MVWEQTAQQSRRFWRSSTALGRREAQAYSPHNLTGERPGVRTTYSNPKLRTAIEWWPCVLVRRVAGGLMAHGTEGPAIHGEQTREMGAQ